MTETVGSSAWLRRVFEEEARDDLFTGHAPQEQPVLVLLGGQPAAGKTRAQHAILAEHAADDLVEITGDDLREYHPEFRRLSLRAPFEMPAATAPVSGGLVKLALDHALSHRYSVLLEGTFRAPAMVTGTATRFAEAGSKSSPSRPRLRCRDCRPRCDLSATARTSPAAGHRPKHTKPPSPGRPGCSPLLKRSRTSRECGCSPAKPSFSTTNGMPPGNGKRSRSPRTPSGTSSSARCHPARPLSG